MILLETLLPALVGLVFLCYLGYAPTLLLLPRSLGGLRWTALPWSGYAVLVVFSQFLTQAGLDMTATTLLALGLTTLANGILLLRYRGVDDISRLIWPGSNFMLVGVTALVGLLGIVPLLFYGYYTIIGENWDGEIYLALGEYLRSYAQPHLVDAAANPLLHTLLVPPYSGRTHGYSYFQAAVGALTGQPSLVTLAPTLALLRALAVPATYFFFRAAWAWTMRPALTAAAVLGLNPFLLWITYNTFGMQVPTLGLIPISVAATLLALRLSSGSSADSVWREVAYAALLTAALAVTYHPALTAWAAIVGTGGLVLLITGGRQWGRVVLRGLGVVAGALLLSAVAQIMALDGFLQQYADQPSGLGLFSFTAPTDALGLSLSFRSLLSAGPGQALLAVAAQGYGVLVALAGLVCAGLILHWALGTARQVPVALATFAGGLIYMLLFLRPLSYPYGWFKAQSFVAFLLVGAVVGGITPLGAATASLWRRIPATTALLPAGVLLLTLGLLVWQYHWPLRYSREMMDTALIRDYVRPGDSALVSSSRLMPGRLFSGVLSYFLRDAQLYGTFSTANSAWDRIRPDGVYTWGVLPARELPAPYGYRPQDRTWSNSLLTLYRAHADLLYTRSWDRNGDYPQVATGSPLSWTVAPDSVRTGAASAMTIPSVSRTLELGLATFVTGTLYVGITPGTGQPMSGTVQLAPGLQTLTLPVAAPAGVSLLLNPGAAPIAVRWATLRAAPAVMVPTFNPSPPITDLLVLQIESAARESTVLTTLHRVDTRPPDRRADRVVLDVYRSPATGNASDHLGYWTFLLTGPISRFSVPLAGGSPQEALEMEPLLSANRLHTAAPGRYTASVTFYHGDTPLDTVTDIYGFTVGTQGIEKIDLRKLPLLFY